MPRPGEDFYLVDEHSQKKGRGAGPRP
jgi:hypothetical protein